MPTRSKCTVVPVHTAVSLDVTMPATGGVLHRPGVNSMAPGSGAVVLRVVPFMSAGTCGSGVPELFTALLVTAKLLEAGAANTGSASWLPLS